MKKALGVIPARLGSSRFPGKPLAEFFGKTMIEHTYAAATASSLLHKVLVATDSERIRSVIAHVGGDSVLTGDCDTGTDRIVQALQRMDPRELSEYDVIVNLQGDEPGVNPAHINLCVAALRADPTSVMSTLATPILNERDATSRDVVKCVADHQGYVICVLYWLISTASWLSEPLPCVINARILTGTRSTSRVRLSRTQRTASSRPRPCT